MAASHRPSRMLSNAWSRAKRLEEHAVSMVKLGPDQAQWISHRHGLTNIICRKLTSLNEGQPSAKINREILLYLYRLY